MEGVLWEAQKVFEPIHSASMLNTRKGTDGGISVSGLNEDQNGFRSWQQDDGVVHIFGSPEVEDIADGKGMTGGIGSPDSVMREVAASSILTQGFGASFVKRKSKKALLQRKQSASNLSSPSAKEFREPTRVSLLDERTEPRDCAPPNMNVKNPAIEAVARPVEGSQSQEQQQQLYAPKPRRPSMGPACARAEAPHHAGRRLIAKVRNVIKVIRCLCSLDYTVRTSYAMLVSHAVHMELYLRWRCHEKALSEMVNTLYILKYQLNNFD